MKLQCKTCGSGYKIDAAKLKKEITRLKCKACGETIIVSKPKEAPTVKSRRILPAKLPTAPSRDIVPDKKSPPIQKPRYTPLILASTLILLSSLVLGMLTVDRYLKTLLIDFAKDELMRQAKINSVFVSRYFNQKTRLAIAVSKNIKVIRAAKEQAQGLRKPFPAKATVTGKMRAVTRLKVQNYLSKMFSLWSDELENLFIGDVYGTIMADGLDGTSIGMSLDREPGQNSGWRQAFNDEIVFEGFRLSSFPEQKTVLASTVYVPMKDNGGVFGSVGLTINCSVLEKTILENHTGGSGYTILTDRSGQILVHPEKKYCLKKKLGDLPGEGWKALSKRMLDRQSGFATLVLNQTNHLVYFNPVKPAGKHFDAGLSIASIIHEEEVFRKAISMRNQFGFLIAAAIILSLIILWIVVRSTSTKRTPS